MKPNKKPVVPLTQEQIEEYAETLLGVFDDIRETLQDNFGVSQDISEVDVLQIRAKMIETVKDWDH